MKLNLKTIGIVGGGAWGTALAVVAARKGRHVLLWMRNAEDAAAINATHHHPRRLGDIVLPPNIEAITDRTRLAAVDATIFAVPSHALATAVSTSLPLLPDGAPVIIATKGILPGDGALTSLAHLPYFISGPSFAHDVARGLPAAVVLAGYGRGNVARLGNALGTPAFRVYFSEDVAGLMMCGPVKNMLAIACGIADGLKLGDSARAALISRGMAELTRIGLACGGHYETFNGLAGAGDIVLTATSRQSRNFSLGVALGEGTALAEAIGAARGVCEGVAAAPAVMALARGHRCELPICDAVERILNGGLSPRAAMAELLDRPFTAE